MSSKKKYLQVWNTLKAYLSWNLTGLEQELLQNKKSQRFVISGL
jgi:hypothetical protein